MTSLAASADTRRDRAWGAFIGLAVGDALGSTIEFSRRDTLPPVTDMIGGGPFRLKPGEWTDDTSMALCLAESLVASSGALDAVDLAQRFVRWWKDGENSVKGYCFDIGNTTSAALTSFLSSGAPKADRDPSSAGNGGIMRLSPAVIVAGNDVAKAVRLARGQSEVTHAALECLDSADVLARILVEGIAGGGHAALDAGRHAKLKAPRVRAIAEGGWRGKPRAEISSAGYVVDTLEASLWAVGRSRSFADAVLLAVNLGHDSDTVGAVTGQIAGAIWGYDAIPERWRKTIAWKEKLLELANALWRIGAAI